MRIFPSLNLAVPSVVVDRT